MTALAENSHESLTKSNVVFLRIEPHLVDTVWERCKDFLSSSFSKNAPTYDEDDVHKHLLSGECQLWIALGNGRIMAAATTIITVEPKAKTLAVLNLGGEDLRDWIKPLDEEFTKFAVENGCHYIEAVTRKGFNRFVPDFIEDGRVYIKRVGTIQ